jgi:hypothetical protein
LPLLRGYTGSGDRADNRSLPVDAPVGLALGAGDASRIASCDRDSAVELIHIGGNGE